MFSICIKNINNKIHLNIYHSHELEFKSKTELNELDIKYKNLDLFECFTILLQFIKSHGINSIHSNFFNKENYNETNIKYINNLSKILDTEKLNNNLEKTQYENNFNQYFDESGRLTCYF